MPIVIDFSTDTDLAKLKEILLYIAEQSKDDVAFGAVKLNKILYYADFRAYRELGHSITGATYQHLREGPAPREFLAAKKELLRESAATEQSRSYFNHTQTRLVCGRPPDLSHFACEEIAILEDTIKELWPYNGAEVSDMSHREWGWKLTELGETIEYRTAWLSPDPLTQEQIEAGINLWEEIGG